MYDGWAYRKEETFILQSLLFVCFIFTPQCFKDILNQE